MAIEYGVLRGVPVGQLLLAKDNQHLEVKVRATLPYVHTCFFRISINIKSSTLPSEVLYYVGEDFNSYQLEYLLGIEEGFTMITENNRRLALDYVRGNLFNPSKMRPLPNKEPGPDNDLHEKLAYYIEKAIEQQATIYAFGERWGPEGRRDDYFKFTPGNGIHNIHMNQGSQPPWHKDNGIWQDGGLLIHQPSGKWIGVFLAFQSQSWNTDDKGNVINIRHHTEYSK